MLQALIESGREAQRTGAWDEALAHFESALQLLPAEGDSKTKADLFRYAPKLKSGGLLLLHDFTYPEVQRACADYLATRQSQPLGQIHSLKIHQMR